MNYIKYKTTSNCLYILIFKTSFKIKKKKKMAKLEGKRYRSMQNIVKAQIIPSHSFKTGGFKNNKNIRGKIKCLKKVPY